MVEKLPLEYSPKYRIICDELRAQISDGHYAPGETLPSQRALVRQYEVSLSTVRQSLSELAREGVVRAEPGRGFFVQQLNDSVAHVRKQRVGQIGFACSSHSASNLAYSTMVNAASAVAQEMGATMRYTFIEPDDLGGVERCIELAPDLEGMIVCGLFKAESLRGRLLDDRKIVVLGDLPDDSDCERFNWIAANGHAAGHLAVQMLLLAGHKKLGLVTRPGITQYYTRLEEGFRCACDEAQLCEPTIFRDPSARSHDDDKRIANDILSDWGVTGLVVIDDARAARITTCLREAGCHVPRDIKCCGRRRTAA